MSAYLFLNSANDFRMPVSEAAYRNPGYEIYVLPAICSTNEWPFGVVYFQSDGMLACMRNVSVK